MYAIKKTKQKFGYVVFFLETAEVLGHLHLNHLFW